MPSGALGTLQHISAKHIISGHGCNGARKRTMTPPISQRLLHAAQSLHVGLILVSGGDAFMDIPGDTAESCALENQFPAPVSWRISKDSKAEDPGHPRAKSGAQFSQPGRISL